MNAIDAQLVREFFETSGFRVLTVWPQSQRADGSTQLFVEHSAPQQPDEEVPVRLAPADLANIDKALVEIRPWHTDKLYGSAVESNPILSAFAEDENLLHAREYFRGEDFARILIISELPNNPEQRARTIKCIGETAVDHIIEFTDILRTLLDAVNPNGAYTGSFTLQLLQLLKRYRLVERQQMEFRFPNEPPAIPAPPVVETAANEDDQAMFEPDEWE